MLNQEVINAFGLRVKRLREDKKISQEELSFQTGFHRTYIGMVERGERNISLSNIAVFAKVFGINIADLLDLEKVKSDLSFTKYELKSEKAKSITND